MSVSFGMVDSEGHVMISLSSLRGYREVQARRAGSWYCCKCSLSAVNLHDFWCHNLCVCVRKPAPRAGGEFR